MYFLIVYSSHSWSQKIRFAAAGLAAYSDDVNGPFREIMNKVGA
jgi:hypothetical protein